MSHYLVKVRKKYSLVLALMMVQPKVNRIRELITAFSMDF